ncbi:DUF3500 domain-containing protein [Mycolicibacterium septicum]|uniref:DUF3500 domain-containing protein n=1 Tax=Mycolicibacterium septicum TaxID=98668 RepID=UPI00235F5420|nr:DUF3500 domain-containing protein [Mycolicibacterium septicum]
MGTSDYRDFVYPPDDPHVANMRGLSYREHVQQMLEHAPPARGALEHWSHLADEPLKGVTTDGHVLPGLYSRRDEGAPVAAMVAAADRLLRLLDPQGRNALQRPLDAREWRMWNNTEIYFFDYGIRLEDQPLDVRDAALALVAASLSDEGYRTTRHTMWLNEFLGELTAAPGIFNEWSYNFTLFGEVSLVEPWGWQLMGHHLSLNCVVIGGQMVLSPVFIGAEPAYLQDGPYGGVAALIDREVGGWELLRSLRPSLREQVMLYNEIRHPDLPPGRVHMVDQLHLGGAFQDNRVIGYEGAPGREFDGAERRKLLGLVDTFLAPLPSGPRSARLAEVEEHLDETYFSWIGSMEENRPFYYRIQSPVILAEFDHHSGILLSNKVPMTFHIHTLVRTPNGNDYGNDLLRQHYSAHEHGTGGHVHQPHG